MIDFFLFIIAITICFYIPGKVFASYCRFKLISLEAYIFPLVLGFVSFTFICYLLDSVHIFFLIYPILLYCFFLFIKNKLSRFTPIDKKDWYPLLVIIFLSIIFTFPFWFSGVYPDGLHLVNINATDSMFHISMINEMQHHFPPDHPGFAGTRLSGYHIFADYVWAKLIQVFHIDVFSLFFRCEPMFIALLWGIGVYLLMKKWTKSSAAGLWSVFLTQFGGSFVFLMYFFGHKTLALDSGFGMLQAAVSLINPPYATSIIIIIFALFSLLSYLQTNEKKWLLPIILFFGIAAEFKVYAGILLIGGFVIFLAFRFFQGFWGKRFFAPTIDVCAFLGILLVFYFTYLRLAGKGGFLIYYPYWAPIDVVRSNLSFMNYDNQMYVYAGYGMWWRIAWLQIRIFCMFLFGNLGSRMIGLLLLYFNPKKKQFFLSPFTVTLFGMLLIAFFIPLLCIQSIKPFEITQMFNYFLFFASLFAAVGFTSFFQLAIPKIIKTLLIIVVILITLPSAYSSFQDYLPSAFPTVPTLKYQKMQLIKKQGTYDNTILILPLLNDPNSFSKPDSWLHSIHMLVPALVNKRGFFNDENITYPDDLQKRTDFLAKIARLEDAKLSLTGDTALQNDIITNLHNNHIAYIYSQYKLSVVKEIKITSLYETKDAYVYQVL